MYDQIALQNFLRKKLAEIQAKNPSFSQRAFAQKLGVSPGALSGILNANRVVSYEIAEKILSKVEADPFEKNEVLKHFAKKSIMKNGDSLTQTEKEVGVNVLTLDESQFKKVSSWVHYAILSLVKLSDFSSDSSWIAQRLGVSKVEVETAVEDLVNVGVLYYNEEERLKRTGSRIKTSDDVPSTALKNFYKETLEHSKQKLDSIKIEHRDYITCTFPASLQRLTQAKMIIRRFSDEISALMDDADATEVYRLGIQLYPLTVLENLDNKDA